MAVNDPLFCFVCLTFVYDFETQIRSYQITDNVAMEGLAVLGKYEDPDFYLFDLI
jgi:hypothetical protein